MNVDGEEVVERGGGDHRWRLCLCCECGRIGRCTPDHDYYVREGRPDDGPLTCEPCLLRGYKVIVQGAPRPEEN